MIFEIPERAVVRYRDYLERDPAFKIKEGVLRIDTDKLTEESVEWLHVALSKLYRHAEHELDNRSALYHFSSTDCTGGGFCSSECLCVKINFGGGMEIGFHLPSTVEDDEKWCGKCAHRARPLARCAN